MYLYFKILQGRWQHGEEVGNCYPNELEKTICKWDIHFTLVMKGLRCAMGSRYLYLTLRTRCMYLKLGTGYL
jgi:hypothetical protein